MASRPDHYAQLWQVGHPERTSILPSQPLTENLTDFLVDLKVTTMRLSPVRLVCGTDRTTLTTPLDCALHQFVHQPIHQSLPQAALDLPFNQLQQRPVSYILSSNSSLQFPACQGTWLEFGVAGGATITWTAKYREAVCGQHAPPVYGCGAAH